MAKASMAPIGDPHKRTYRAEGGALTRGYGVMQGTAADQAKAPTGAAVEVLGVVDENVAAAGDPASVILHGECIAIAGAAISAGDRVKIMANGKWEPGNSADVATGGKALCAAAADGDEFVMFVQPLNKRSV